MAIWTSRGLWPSREVSALFILFSDKTNILFDQPNLPYATIYEGALPTFLNCRSGTAHLPKKPFPSIDREGPTNLLFPIMISIVQPPLDEDVVKAYPVIDRAHNHFLNIRTR